MHECVSVQRSPGDGRHPSAVLIDEVSAGVEHPAVVEGGEGVSSRGGRVLAILSVGVLQRRELVLAQDLVHDKLPFLGHKATAGPTGSNKLNRVLNRSDMQM